MIKKSSAPLIPAIIFALILLVGASVQVPAKAESSAYSASKVLTTTYSWKRDHCESCDYLAKRIKFWMNESNRLNKLMMHGSSWRHKIMAANASANYLKLYELNGCHEYYRNTSIGPFHLALELKALEKGRLE